MKHNKGRSISDLEKLIKQKENELFELQQELEQAEEYRREQTKKFITRVGVDDVFKIGDIVIYQRLLNDNSPIGYQYEGSIYEVLPDNFYIICVIDGFRKGYIKAKETELCKYSAWR